LEFNPHATHVEELTPVVQDSVLPAADNAGPAATLKPAIPVEGKVKVH
jgi:hypothetical protein